VTGFQRSQQGVRAVWLSTPSFAGNLFTGEQQATGA